MSPFIQPTLNPSQSQTSSTMPNISTTTTGNSVPSVVKKKQVNISDPKKLRWFDVLFIIIAALCVCSGLLLMICLGTCFYGDLCGCRDEDKPIQKYRPVQPSAPSVDADDNDEKHAETTELTGNAQESCLMCCNVANAFNSCGHITYCMDCAPLAAAQYNNECPICRQRVTYK